MPNEQTAQSLAAKIADYRFGEIAQPDGEHVLRWVHQFPEAVRAGVLSEMDHVLGKTYCSRASAVQFLAGLLTNAALAGENAGLFWHQANLLDIQQNGNSQKEMLGLFKELLAAGYGQNHQTTKSNVYVYIDDAIFTGNRVGNDLEAWLKSDAPRIARVHIIVLAVHTLGSWQLGNRLKKAAADAGKDITFSTWRIGEIENRKAYRAIHQKFSGLYPFHPAQLSILEAVFHLNRVDLGGQKAPSRQRPLGNCLRERLLKPGCGSDRSAQIRRQIFGLWVMVHSVSGSVRQS